MLGIMVNYLCSLCHLQKSVEVGAILQKRLRNLKQMLIKLTGVTQSVSKQGQGYNVDCLAHLHIYKYFTSIYSLVELTEGSI